MKKSILALITTSVMTLFSASVLMAGSLPEPAEMEDPITEMESRLSELEARIAEGMSYVKSLDVVYNEGLEDLCATFILQKGVTGRRGGARR